MINLLSLARRATLALLLIAPSAVAQPDTVPGSVKGGRLSKLCWWEVRPASHCPLWVVSEFAWEHPVASTTFTNGDFRREDIDDRYVVAIGTMVNHQPNAALGAVFAFHSGEYGPDLLRAELRYRRWLGTRTGLDLGVGHAREVVPQGSGLDDIAARGITAGIGLEYRWIGIDARIDRLDAGGRPRNATLVGVHTSSSATLSIYVVGLALGIVAFLAMPFIGYED